MKVKTSRRRRAKKLADAHAASRVPAIVAATFTDLVALGLPSSTAC